MVISEKTILFQGFRASPTFSRVGGGSNRVRMLISIETHITCHFRVGEPVPLSPLLTRSCSLSPSGSAHELPRENAHPMKDLGNTLSNQIFLSVIIKHSKLIPAYNLSDTQLGLDMLVNLLSKFAFSQKDLFSRWSLSRETYA